MKNWIRNLKWKFEWMKVYFSPFKPIVPKLYIGKIAIGTPYFYPRTLRKLTHAEACIEAVKERNKFAKLKSENSNAALTLTFPNYDTIYKNKLNQIKFTDKKIGFDFVGLGWKTKWKDTDYRHEYNPVWSFVFFKWQIALIFRPEHDIHYWECWLYYSRNTKGITKERLKQARKEFPCTWTSIKNDVKTKTCYWNVILKNK